MTKRPSIDEIIARRKSSADDDGKLYKAVVLDETEAKGYDPDRRAQRFVMSSETVDLYGDIVRQDGIKLDNFMKNPVGLAYHNQRAPIGWWGDVKVVRGRPKRTEGVLTLHPAGTTEAVDEVDRLLAASAIRACSIGFKALEADWIYDEEGRNTYGLDFIESLLLECSVCAIPAQPDALAKAAGGDMRLAAELFERVLDTYCEQKSGGLFVKKEFADAYFEIKTPKTVVEAPKSDHSITVTLDLEEAERQAESFVAKWSKKFGDLFKVQDWSAYEVTNQAVGVDEHGVAHLLANEWPRHTIAKKDGAGTLANDDVITIDTAESTARYRIVGECKEFPDDDRVYVDLIDVTPKERTEPDEPVLIEGSRAKAAAKTAKLRASLIARGVLT